MAAGVGGRWRGGGCSLLSLVLNTQNMVLQAREATVAGFVRMWAVWESQLHCGVDLWEPHPVPQRFHHEELDTGCHPPKVCGKKEPC